MKVEFYRSERAPEPAEEILNWSVQIPLDHQISFGELQEAVHELKVSKVPPEARVQMNGNLLMVWVRRTLNVEGL
jgi:hypothetical protein